MIPIQIPPGVSYGPTEASKSSAWREVNLVRWTGGRMSPVGGWERMSYSFASRVRAIRSWISNAGNYYIGYLCESHLYVDSGGTLYDITPTGGIIAPNANALAGGFGDNNYNLNQYGTPRPNLDGARLIPPCFTLDVWGDQLLAMTSPDGRLLRWDPSGASPLTTKATAVTNAPVNNRSFVVTPERYIIIAGKGGYKNCFGWCAREDYSNWNVSDVNTDAGEYFISPSSPIISVKLSANGVVVFTSDGVRISRSIGTPYVYSNEDGNASSVPISAASAADTPVGMIWVSNSGFWVYNGTNVTPLDCPVWAWVSERKGTLWPRFESTMVHLADLSELVWFFPSVGSRYNDRYVSYNYTEGWWSTGYVGRSAGFSGSYNSYPVMADGLRAYKHESGTLYADYDDGWWAESYTMNYDSGAKMSTVGELLLDITGEYSDVEFTILYKNDRLGDALLKRSKVMKANSAGRVFPRVTGRDFRLRMDGPVGRAVQCTMGQTNIDVTPRGSR